MFGMIVSKHALNLDIQALEQKWKNALRSVEQKLEAKFEAREEEIQGEKR